MESQFCFRLLNTTMLSFRFTVKTFPCLWFWKVLQSSRKSYMQKSVQLVFYKHPDIHFINQSTTLPVSLSHYYFLAAFSSKWKCSCFSMQNILGCGSYFWQWTQQSKGKFIRVRWEICTFTVFHDFSAETTVLWKAEARGIEGCFHAPRLGSVSWIYSIISKITPKKESGCRWDSSALQYHEMTNTNTETHNRIKILSTTHPWSLFWFICSYPVFLLPKI